MVPVLVPFVVSVSVYGPLSSLNSAFTFSCPSNVSVCGVVVPVRLP